MHKLLRILIFFIQGSMGFAQNNKDLNIDIMLRGYIYAASSIKDSLAPGGFGRSDNVAKKITDSLNFSERGFFMKIDTGRIRTFAKEYNGYTLFMVNKSDTLVTLRATDSR